MNATSSEPLAGATTLTSRIQQLGINMDSPALFFNACGGVLLILVVFRFLGFVSQLWTYRSLMRKLEKMGMVRNTVILNALRFLMLIYVPEADART